MLFELIGRLLYGEKYKELKEKAEKPRHVRRRKRR